MTAVPIETRRVARPAAPNHTQALPQCAGGPCSGDHHGARWGLQQTASKPASSAAIACSTSSGGLKRSCPRDSAYATSSGCLRLAQSTPRADSMMPMPPRYPRRVPRNGSGGDENTNLSPNRSGRERMPPSTGDRSERED